MRIFNVVEIHDDDDVAITIVTKSGTAVHLPLDGKHSIIIQPMTDPSDNYLITVNIDLYQG